MTKLIENIMIIALILGFIFLSMMVTRYIYKPTEAEVGRVVEGVEKARHDRLMAKHGRVNTEVVENRYDGSQWYKNRQGQYCQFK